MSLQLIYQTLPPSLGVTNLDDHVAALTLTNLRIRFTRLNILPGDNVTDVDTRMNYYYAVYNMVLRGRCFCHGNEEACELAPNVVDPEPGTVSCLL